MNWLKIYVFASCLAIACSCFSSNIYAETIKLKSGKIITADISEKNDEQLKVNVDGVSVTYFTDDVETIDGAPASEYNKQAATSVSENQNPQAGQVSSGALEKTSQQLFTEADPKNNKLLVVSVSLDSSWQKLPDTNDKGGIRASTTHEFTKEDMWFFVRLRTPGEADLHTWVSDEIKMQQEKGIIIVEPLKEIQYGSRKWLQVRAESPDQNKNNFIIMSYISYGPLLLEVGFMGPQEEVTRELSAVEAALANISLGALSSLDSDAYRACTKTDLVGTWDMASLESVVPYEYPAYQRSIFYEDDKMRYITSSSSFESDPAYQALLSAPVTTTYTIKDGILMLNKQAVPYPEVYICHYCTKAVVDENSKELIHPGDIVEVIPGPEGSVQGIVVLRKK
ncbi:MAG: hypothetical protein PHS93_00555 [Candidatus Omnitrophica bacterium]|nr:hypothetical protein [Candidatus Omnitrophota bacterium]MDD5351644.1 hypothetical protein [Candidatus Omnitrophota bacterium]MDD5550854.1 hypothetical protein [Candidatus Omnitrophota bacterium]